MPKTKPTEPVTARERLPFAVAAFEANRAEAQQIADAIPQWRADAKIEIQTRVRAMRTVGVRLMVDDLQKHFGGNVWGVMQREWFSSRWGLFLGGDNGTTGIITCLLTTEGPSNSNPITVALALRSHANEVMEANRLLSEFEKDNPELAAGIDVALAEEELGNAQNAEAEALQRKQLAVSMGYR